MKGIEAEGSLIFLSLKSCYPPGPGTLPSAHLATIGREMMSISHCGFGGVSKIEEKEMWLECGLPGFPDTSIYMRR